MSFGKIFLGSGHMIDAPDRAAPRFPEAKAELVRTAIGQWLERWKIGSDDLAICSGACGADILFGEEALRRGAKVQLRLAEAEENFVRTSVERAGEEWVRRFRALADRAEVLVLPESFAAEIGGSIYQRTNLWMVDAAERVASDETPWYAIMVWDERPAGDGPGGTSDFEARIREVGAEVAIINPLRLGVA